MIRLITYSRDRAAQLDLLLRSLEQYAGNIFRTTIIWNYSDIIYKKAYERLIKSHPDIDWRYQELSKEFREFTLEELNRDDYVCFTTDDEVVFRPIDNEKLTKNLPQFDNHIFSLRLGFNTIEQDIHRGTKQPPLNIYVERDGVLTWPVNYYNAFHNYGYPFSLDMHIYRSNLLRKILPQIEFKNSNELEGNLTKFRDNIEYLSSFTESCAVNLPINNMSNLTQSGMKYSYSNFELNQLFLDNYIIDLEEICKHKIIGCHQELPLTFIKNV